MMDSPGGALLASPARRMDDVADSWTYEELWGERNTAEERFGGNIKGSGANYIARWCRMRIENGDYNDYLTTMPLG